MFSIKDRCSYATAIKRTGVFVFCFLALMSFVAPKASYAGEWWAYVNRQGLTDVKNSDPIHDFNNGRPSHHYPLNWNTQLEEQGTILEVEKTRVPSASVSPNGVGLWVSHQYDPYWPDHVSVGYSSTIHLGLNPIDALEPDAPGTAKVVMLWCDSNGNPSSDTPPSNVTFDVTSRMSGNFDLQGLSYQVLSSYADFQASTAALRVHFDNGFGSPTITTSSPHGTFGATQEGTRQYSCPVTYKSAVGYYTAETPDINIKLNWAGSIPLSSSYDSSLQWAFCVISATLP